MSNQWSPEDGTFKPEPWTIEKTLHGAAFYPESPTFVDRDRRWAIQVCLEAGYVTQTEVRVGPYYTEGKVKATLSGLLELQRTACTGPYRDNPKFFEAVTELINKFKDIHDAPK